MKLKWAVASLILSAGAVGVIRADSTGNTLGNQLTSNNVVPITERPATIVGAIPEISAPEGNSLLTLQSGSALYLAGDSTLHKYEMGAKSLRGSAVLMASSKSLKAEGGLLNALKAGNVKTMELDVPVTFLKSKESGLDSNAYKSLLAAGNPLIKFVLKTESVTEGKDAASYFMTAQGDLSVAGASQPVTLNAEIQVKDGQVRIKGVQKLKMTDYKITPPKISLLIASIVCTDEIEIHYDVTFAPSAKE